MIVEMRDMGRKLSERDLQRLETNCEIHLPRDYSEFLLRYNGGVPAPTVFPIEGMENNPEGAIQEFLGIEQSINSSNLIWTYDMVRQRLPPNLFPIARTGSGDLICISLFGEDEGAVLFWDFYNPTEPPSYDNVYLIARDFPSFLESIHAE